jgi:hypothetical protein
MAPRKKLPRARVVRGNAGKHRRAASPPDPPGYKPVPVGSMTDITLLPNLFRRFVATYEADHDWLKEKITAILTRLDSMERRADLHEQRLGSLDRRVDDHEQRIERLEGAKKGTEP